MKRTSYLVFVLLVLLIMALLAVGCSGQQQGPAGGSAVPEAKTAGDNKPAEAPAKPKTLEKIVIANPSMVLVFMPVYWGVEKGYFAEEGLEAQVMETKTNILVSGMVGGDIHYGTSSGTIVRAAIQGMPVRIAAYMALKPDFVLVSQPNISDVKGLKGKVVASSNPTATSTVALLTTLKHFDMTEKDVNLQYINGSGDRIAALVGKSIDAAILAMPYEIEAEKQGMRDLYFSGSLMDTPFSGLGTTIQRLKDNPEQVKKVLKVILRGLQDIQKNKAEVVPFIAKTWNIDEKGAAKEYDKLIQILSKDGSAPESSVLADVKAMREELKLDVKDVKISDVADFSLLKAVQKEMGL